MGNEGDGGSLLTKKEELGIMDFTKREGPNVQ